MLALLQFCKHLMATVLVLGASGYLGQFLVQQLLADDWLVIAASATRAVEWPAGVVAATADVTNPVTVAALLEAHAPAVVVNCAAIAVLGACESDPEAVMAVNCPKGLLDVLNASPPSLFAHVSTDIVYSGRAEGEPLYDESVAAPPSEALNVYGRTKACMEVALAASARFPFTILRCSNMLGPPPPFLQGKHTVKFVQWLFTELTAGRAVNAFDDEVRSYVSVADVVATILAACARARAGAADTLNPLYNVGGPVPLTRVQIASLVRDALGPAATGTVTACKRADAGIPYAAPLDAGMCSAAAEGLVGRPFRDVREYIAGTVIPALL